MGSFCCVGGVFTATEISRMSPLVPITMAPAFKAPANSPSLLGGDGLFTKPFAAGWLGSH